MKLFFIILFFSAHALSIDPMDDYYANDLLDAVDQAKSSAHHYDYSHHYRYKRTTAQSIELNRLNLKELDETALKSKNELAEEPAINKAVMASANSKQNFNSSNNSINSPQEQFIPSISLPKYSDYTSAYGQFQALGIQGESSMITTARP
jgi:hypothetical protein